MSYSVYIHRCTKNGKVYVGCTSIRPEKRWSYGYKHNADMSNDIRKFGWDAFEHIVYRRGLSEIAAFNLEKKLINELDAKNPERGYNRSNGGERGPKDVRKFGADNYHSVQVYSPEMDECFGSISQAAKFASTSIGSIRKCLCGESKFAGTSPFTGLPVTWQLAAKK